MSREEAINIIKSECYIFNPLNFDMSTMINTALDMAIQALEQESVLDKIRTEIDRARFIDKDTRHCRNALASGLEVALDIIDKYRTESEG